MPEQVYYVYMPATADDELTKNEFRVYGHCLRLTAQHGICQAHPATMAAHCGIASNLMHSILEGLVDKGYITLSPQGNEAPIIQVLKTKG